ncbi:MAG: hypothetical protein HYZ90_01385 [Candidatus Omnitrophica bacterium]|nr:hypothetical protein [Candidatus Omnitrophota bacterium]
MRNRWTIAWGVVALIALTIFSSSCNQGQGGKEHGGKEHGGTTTTN